jgi:hypothetical protein
MCVTVYSWVRRGVVPYYRIEGCIRFDPNEIEAWLRERKKNTRPKLHRRSLSRSKALKNELKPPG